MRGHTVEEAQHQWCPMIRLHNPSAGAVASGYNWVHVESETAAAMDWRDTACKASLCMAWRWTDDTKQHGYCGLSGQL